MGQKIKKTLAVLLIVVLLPYIITIFMNGKKVETKEDIDAPEALLEEYCMNRLAKEVSSDYEEEMLKVQALLVRTTVYKEVEEKGKEVLEEEGQAGKIDFAWRQRLEKVWEDTANEVIMYEDKLALVPFHQVSNGKTRSGKEVLGSEDYPYLQVRECPKDVEAENQMESKFIEVKNATVTSYDSTGYALEVKVGEETCSGESFRNAYGLASGCFDLQSFEDRTRVVTKGVGHGLGLSQYTANEMAKEGKTYKEILQYFFEKTEIKEVAQILWDTE